MNLNRARLALIGVQTAIQEVALTATVEEVIARAAIEYILIGATEKLVRVKAWRGHHLDIKSSRRTRRYAGKATVDSTSAKQVRRLLPYL